MHLTLGIFSKLILLAFILSAISASALADQITLKNGDRLSGSVIAKRGNTLTFNTSYAGELKIDWDEVARLETDSKVDVMLKDDSHQQLALNSRSEPTSSTMPALGDIAYINPNPEESGRGYRVSGKVNFAYTQSEGNSTSDQLHADAEMIVRARDYRLTLGGELDEASVDKKKADDSRRAYGSYDSFFNKKEFLFAHGQLQNDRFRDIDLRTVVGGGYGYQLYDTETTRLSIKGGLDMVDLDRYNAPRERFAALGWHIDLVHKLARSDVEFFHVQDGYRGLSSEASVLVQTRTGLRFPLSSGLHALTQLNLDWESDPAPGRENLDSKVMIGLGYAYD
jgi:putative salt-induced outer membrane protein YdiY